jgi:hypothetical protein
LLRDNKFGGSIPQEIRRLNLLYELQFDGNLASGSTTGVSCVNRKLGHGLVTFSIFPHQRSSASTRDSAHDELIAKHV